MQSDYGSQISDFFKPDELLEYLKVVERCVQQKDRAKWAAIYRYVEVCAVNQNENTVDILRGTPGILLFPSNN